MNNEVQITLVSGWRNPLLEIKYPAGRQDLLDGILVVLGQSWSAKGCRQFGWEADKRFKTYCLSWYSQHTHNVGAVTRQMLKPLGYKLLIRHDIPGEGEGG